MNEIPLSTDEENVFVTSYGRNETPYVELLGWTKDIPVGFPGLKEDLKISTVSFIPGSQVPDHVLRSRASCTALRELDRTVSSIRVKLPGPIEVRVFAKKKFDVLVKNEEAMILGSLVIGDETGFCFLSAFNEGNFTVFEHVEVGDRLLICDGSYITRFDHPFKPCLPPHLQLDMEVKISLYNARRIYRIQDNSNSKLPEIYFKNPTTKLWLPSDFIQKDKGFIKPNAEIEENSKENFYVPDVNIEYFDVIGIITYVGRLERVEKYSCEAEYGFIKKNNGTNTSLGIQFQDKVETKTFIQYTPMRFIQIIDAHVDKPLSLQFFISNTMWESQKVISPGSLVIITNCKSVDVAFTEGCLKSSVFSKVYVNEEVSNYLKLMPISYGRIASEFMSLESCKRILRRKHFNWSAGGSLSQPFVSEELFNLNYHSSTNDENKKWFRFPTVPIVRRQTQRIYFPGKIFKVWEVHKGDIYQFIYINKEFNIDELKADFKEFRMPIPYSFYERQQWFSFIRQMPSIEIIDIDQCKTTKELLRRVTQEYTKYCKSLAMPSDPDRSLKDLEMLNGPPYYYLHIVDKESKHCYYCLWRSLPFEQMKKKLLAAFGKPLLCMIDIYCIEESIEVELEVILQDFTTNVDYHPTDS